MYEGEREVEAAFHPARVALHLAVGRLCQPDPVEQLGAPCASFRARKVV